MADADKTVKADDSKEGGISVVNSTTYQVVLRGVDPESSYAVTIWANTTVGRGRTSPPLLVPRKSCILGTQSE